MSYSNTGRDRPHWKQGDSANRRANGMEKDTFERETFQLFFVVAFFHPTITQTGNPPSSPPLSALFIILFLYCPFMVCLLLFFFLSFPFLLRSLFTRDVREQGSCQWVSLAVTGTLETATALYLRCALVCSVQSGLEKVSWTMRWLFCQGSLTPSLP